MSDLALLILGIQFTSVIVSLTTIDWILRRKDDKTKPQWLHDNALYSWTHFGVVLLNTLGIALVWISIYVKPSELIKYDIKSIIFIILFGLFFIVDLFKTVRMAASLLRLKYVVKRNPYGIVFWFIIIGIYVIFLIPMFYNPFKNVNINEFRIFIVIYLLGFMVQYTIYFKQAYIFLFKVDGSVSANIIGFQSSIMSPFWNTIYAIIKFLISLIMLIVNYNPYVIIFGLQIWLFSMYYTRKINRFKQCRGWCCIYVIWRNLLEYLFNIALKNYMIRNPGIYRPTLAWPKHYWNDIKEEVPGDASPKIDKDRTENKA